MINPRQRPDFYKLHSFAMQYPCDFVHGRTGSDDVVDDGDMTIVASRRIGKSLANVMRALIGAEA